MLNRNHTYVVGIGASAGGMKSIIDFFSMPINLQAAYVVIQHFPRTYSSQLVSILEKQNVEEIKENVSIERGVIYFPPAGTEVRLGKNKLFLTERPNTLINYGVNFFFESLSKRNRRAIGIIMSGAGDDGMNGISSIELAGGNSIIQSLESATHWGMPSSSIKHNRSDYVLSPFAMASAVDKIIERGQALIKNKK